MAITTGLIIAAAASFLIVAGSGPFFIKKMQFLQHGQYIRDDGPASHSAKAGTPTMGGIVIILAAALVSIILAGASPLLYAALLVVLGCGLLGFLDDYYKVAHSRSLGIKARSKLAGEFIIALIFLLMINAFGLYSSEVSVPLINANVNLGWFYPLFVFLIITAASNSVNLTDGIDGLAAGTTVIAMGAFAHIAHRSGLPEISLFCAAVAGACLGFLIYNRHPAKLFMGDVGSLALGGAFAAVAVLTKTELLLIVIGGIFVLEALSVIVQVISFQLTGRRVLLMSPLHHHLELKGWSEWRVVIILWSAALLFAVIGVMVYNASALSTY